MENSESKIERVEQKAHQRPRELGDQQRSEEKARELIGTRDREKALGMTAPENREAQQHSDSGSVRNEHEHIPDGYERDSLCETIKMKKTIIKENRNLTKPELEKLEKDISSLEGQVAKTPIPTC